MPLSAVLQRFRAPSADDVRAVQAYGQEVAGALQRVPAIFDEWQLLLDSEHEGERLANAASVYRWELVRLLAQVEAMRPPRAAGTAHRDLVRGVGDAARACQLLANGYRFHKTDAICDGQILLGEAVDLIARVRGRLENVAGHLSPGR